MARKLYPSLGETCGKREMLRGRYKKHRSCVSRQGDSMTHTRGEKAPKVLFDRQGGSCCFSIQFSSGVGSSSSPPVPYSSVCVLVRVTLLVLSVERVSTRQIAQPEGERVKYWNIRMDRRCQSTEPIFSSNISETLRPQA